LAVALGGILAGWLREILKWNEVPFDWVVPVPQHWVRRITTRYNQSEVLAELVAQSLDIPMHSKLLYRNRWTEKQGTKSIQQRLGSVGFSFACRRTTAVQGKSVLLVDDVVTSGATANDAARALRKAGAKRVEVAAFARGVGAIKGSLIELP
jgi:predicted amidophosphoribosyltransferase